MGWFDRLERKLERVVNGAFARAFRAEVQPVEIASAMRRAMDDRAAVVAHGRTLVPNDFVIELADSDFERLTTYEDMLTDELLASAQAHVETQRYAPGGPLQVQFARGDDLETGVFRVRADTGARKRRPSARHTDHDHQLARPHNLAHPPQATAAADGVAGIARKAATAAESAMASTAAARSAFPAAEVSPPYHVPPPHQEHAPVADPVAHADPPAPEAAPLVPPPPLVDPTSRPWLDVDGDTYPLLGALTVIGRDAAADITFDDPGISRRHAEIRVTHDGPRLVISLRDLGSTNGTYVNGERITSAQVSAGDRITLGRVSLTVRLPRR